jgi:hypothetical protein
MRRNILIVVDPKSISCWHGLIPSQLLDGMGNSLPHIAERSKGALRQIHWAATSDFITPTIENHRIG